MKKEHCIGKRSFHWEKDTIRGSFSLHLKKRMVKAFVWSIALHGSDIMISLVVPVKYLCMTF